MDKPEHEEDPTLPLRSLNEIPCPGLGEVSGLWPGGRRAFLAGLGIRLADFNAWIDGRAAMAPEASAAVHARANARVGNDGRLSLGGGYLLTVTHGRALSSMYEALTGNDAVPLSRELVSPEGRPSAWRFLLFQRADAHPCIVLVEPGGSAGRALSRKKLRGFAGWAVATPAVWNSVHFIVRNHEHLFSPGTAGIDFEAIHHKWMRSLYVKRIG